MKQKIKNIIKIVVCSILYYSGLISLFIRLYLNRRGDLPVVILIYHKITENIAAEINQELTINHPLNNFIKEMKFIKKYFNVVSLDDAVELIRNNKASRMPTLAITFDDGFEDNYRLAFPVLKELDLPATIYLTTGYIGTNELPWIEKIGQAILNTSKTHIQLDSCFHNTSFKLNNLNNKRCSFELITSRLKKLEYSERIKLTNEIFQKLDVGNNNMKMLNWQQIEEMSNNNISFGPHTMTHPILSRMPMELAKQEIRDSKLIIEKNLGKPVKHFAFPNGELEDFSEELKQYCKEIGFESVSTAVYGNNQLDSSDVYALKRLSPGKNMSIFAFDLIRGFLRNYDESI